MLERELPRWAGLRHPNVLPFLGVCIFQPLPLKDSHGCVGIVTNIGSRIYWVSGSLRVGKRQVNSSPSGVTIGENRYTGLRHPKSQSEQRVSSKLSRSYELKTNRALFTIVQLRG